MFDSPNVTDCYRRSETVVPQQALAMVNSSLTLAQARRLAAAMAKELDTQPTQESLTTFIGTAFERSALPAPTDAERGGVSRILGASAGPFGGCPRAGGVYLGGREPGQAVGRPTPAARKKTSCMCC